MQIMSFLQISTTFAPYLDMKLYRTYILYYIHIASGYFFSPYVLATYGGKIL